ncbi:MAG: RecF/RecN/SMC N-terminal protein [Mycobacterium sp.]|jgi:hypothetical protein|nr:RecF/RecN/SMC N-terminal protein [Mycobacterium sp.]MDT5181235.1 hypothetical protein [Mycobacterium sp.]
MADQQLSDYVLQRADDDEGLSAQGRSAVLAASQDLPAGASVAEVMSRLDARVEVLARRRAAALTTPDGGEVDAACAALRAAARAQADAECSAGALSADRIQFLETSLEFHGRHGTQPCPVCAEGRLDDDWVVRARAALGAEQDAATALRVARSGAHRARLKVTALVRAVEPPPAEDVALTAIAAARVAYQSFSAVPADGDVALADHVGQTLPALRTAYGALRDEAAALIDDAGADAGPTLESAREAQHWLRALASSLPS